MEITEAQRTELRRLIANATRCLRDGDPATFEIYKGKVRSILTLALQGQYKNSAMLEYRIMATIYRISNEVFPRKASAVAQHMQVKSKANFPPAEANRQNQRSMI